MSRVSEAVGRINAAAQAAIAKTKRDAAKVEARNAAKLKALKAAGRDQVLTPRCPTSQDHAGQVAGHSGNIRAHAGDAPGVCAEPVVAVSAC